MALNYFDIRNMQITSPLVVTYKREMVNVALGHWGTFAGSYWMRYTRQATKQYSYVGLSREAAVRCAEAKTRLYTREFVYWGQDASGNWRRRIAGSVDYVNSYNRDTWQNADKYDECVAQISIRRDAGNLYTVDINVDETVALYMSRTTTQVANERYDQIAQHFIQKHLSNVPTFTYDE